MRSCVATWLQWWWSRIGADGNGGTRVGGRCGDGDDGSHGGSVMTMLVRVSRVVRVVTWRLWVGWGRGATTRWWRGGEWVGGSGRSGEEEHNWYWPKDSPENFSGGRRWWPAAVADDGVAAGRIIWERGRELIMSGLKV
ncbi:hypothetical protein Tco_1549185 [Tanacetum coccineum]